MPPTGRAGVEDEVLDAFESAIEAGTGRLERSGRSLVATGLLGGLEIGLGILAYLVVKDATHDTLLAALAFGAGYSMTAFTHSELYTEDFLVPVLAVYGGRARLRSLLRLWGVTLVANLVGGAVSASLVRIALPHLQKPMDQMAAAYLTDPLAPSFLARAALAGMVITLSTRLALGTDSDAVRLVSGYATSLLLAGAPLVHSVLGGILLLTTMTGPMAAPVGEVVAAIAVSAVLNALGGLVLVTSLRVVRASDVPRGAVDADGAHDVDGADGAGDPADGPVAGA